MQKKHLTLRLQCQVSRHRLNTLVHQDVNRKIVLRHLGRDGRPLQFLVYDVQRILLVLSLIHI